MSYHIVSIDAPRCSLLARNGQLICRTDNEERSLPLEDIASIIVTSFSASIHGHLLLQAAQKGVALIFCEAYRPVSLLFPANRSSDTLLTRAILRLTPKSKTTLWQKTIDAKCHNQLALAQGLAPGHQNLSTLRQVVRSPKLHKEATCARLYWQIIGRSLGEDTFIRERSGGGLNDLLNYGYAVLLSATLQKLYGVGLDPTFGLFHATRERSAPLAYDLMEPFRICVEKRAIEWAHQHQRPWVVTPAYRKWIISFLHDPIPWEHDRTLEVRNVIEGVVRSFRRAVLEGRPTFYKPWTSTNSKWAGSLSPSTSP